MMISSFDTALIIVYLAVLAVVALVGWRRKDDSQESLILAGRRLTLPAFVATLVSTWYGGILGVGEFSFRYGLSNWIVFGIPYYLAALIFALFLAKRARRSPDLTIPDRLYKDYGPAATAAGSTVLIIITLPVAYVLMIGVLFNQFFNFPIWAGIVFGTFFSVFYVATGGFRAVLWTDVFQFILMFAGFIILLIFSVTSLGGIDFLKAHLPAQHFSATGGNPPGYIAFWYIVALATLVEPAFYQRCFAARSETVARRGILISILFWIFFDFLTTTCGLYARAAIPDLSNPLSAYPALAMKLLPAGLTGLFLLSLLATIMSTVDSYMFLAASTVSHDLFWRFKHIDESRIKSYTAIGLAISSVGTIIIALMSESVVNLWHDFGSVGTPALLLPLMTSYGGKYKYSPRGAFVSICLSGAVTVAALFYPRIMGVDAYLLGIEPIFIGLAVSLAVFIFTRIPKIPGK